MRFARANRLARATAAGEAAHPPNAPVPLSASRTARSGAVMTNEDEAMSRAEILDEFRALADAIDSGFKANRAETAELRAEMRAGFAQVDRRMARLDDRVSALENRTAGLEDRVGGLEREMSSVVTRLGRVETRLARVETHLGIVE